MDAAPVIATQAPVAATVESTTSSSVSSDDASAFAAHLPPEEAPIKPLRKIAARMEAETAEPVIAPTTTYALSTPMAPVALRLDATPGLMDVAFTPAPAAPAATPGTAATPTGAPASPAAVQAGLNPIAPTDTAGPASDAKPAAPATASPAPAQKVDTSAPAHTTAPPPPPQATPLQPTSSEVIAALQAPKPAAPAAPTDSRPRSREGASETAEPVEPLRAATAAQPVAAVQAAGAARATGGAAREAGAAPIATATKDDAAAPAPTDSSAAQSHEGRRLHEAASAPPVHRPPTPAATVAQHVVRRFDGHSTTIEVRLDPAELGRVQVKLDVGADARVTATVAADNPATLSDLMRSARDLERALEAAGLELASGGLSFDLSDRRNAGDADPDANGARAALGSEDGDADVASAAPASRPFGLESWRGVRVDVTV